MGSLCFCAYTFYCFETYTAFDGVTNLHQCIFLVVETLLLLNHKAVEKFFANVIATKLPRNETNIRSELWCHFVWT